MFYAKSILPGGKIVRVELTNKNVFTRCCECGCELPIDLAFDLLWDGEDTMDTKTVMCSRCSMKKSDSKDDAMVPLTLKDMTQLANILIKIGHEADLQFLYDYYDIEGLEELCPNELSEFGSALRKMVLDIINA